MLSTFIASTLPFEPMSRYPEQGDLLNWCLNMGLGTGILLMLIGAVYLMYGWSLHKGLVTLNAAAHRTIGDKPAVGQAYHLAGQRERAAAHRRVGLAAEG